MMKWDFYRCVLKIEVLKDYFFYKVVLVVVSQMGLGYINTFVGAKVSFDLKKSKNVLLRKVCL